MRGIQVGAERVGQEATFMEGAEASHYE